jgi:hypothetical protein
MTSPVTSPRRSVPDNLRRTAIVLFVLACLAGLLYACSLTREVDENGDVIAETRDPDDVTVSGDEELIAELPPVGGGGPTEDEIVEQTFPAEGAEILQQQQIGIDLGDQYYAERFYVQGTLLPEGEIVRRDELNQAFFQPGGDTTFDVLPPGRVCARVDVVRSVSRDTPLRTVEWCFEVT